jgi:hypothetical protein
MATSSMPRGRVALVFVVPYDSDTWIVNAATGWHGFGHVAMWAGHMVGRDALVLDSGFDNGVEFRSLYRASRGSAIATFEFDPMLSRWVWARALEQIGCPYDYPGLVRSRRDPCGKHTCSGFVASCLPQHMRDELPGRVSPNDLARYFGVPRR